jgi:uncharacterized protein
MTKRAIFIILSIFILIIIGIVWNNMHLRNDYLINPVTNIKEKTLLKYSFPELKNRSYSPSVITFNKIVNETPDFISLTFNYQSDGKVVSGLSNLPAKAGKYPVLIQFRGYINPDNYTPGAGTIHSGEVFAKNGFITLAPDFLGYGTSISPSADPLEERFETYTTALNLLSSLQNFNDSLLLLNRNIVADTDKVGLWGHSNGGHITLAILSITGKPYPTVLWNPVSKPFPYSILFFSDELPDNGKALRKMISDFENDYDIEKYSPPNYYESISAPIQLHQADEDEAVPKNWSKQLYKTLKDQDNEITYFTYPGENHDFNRGSWPTVVERNIRFYREKL